MGFPEEDTMPSRSSCGWACRWTTDTFRFHNWRILSCLKRKVLGQKTSCKMCSLVALEHDLRMPSSTLCFDIYKGKRRSHSKFTMFEVSLYTRQFK
jgi:hypothetical protein